MLASIRQRLLLLVFLVALPLVIATILVIFQLAATQRDGQRDAMLGSTRILAAAIDSEIETYLAIGRTLATAQSLERADLRDFYNRAVAALSFWPGSWLVLVDAGGQQLVNTSRPYGAALPMITHIEPHRRAIETREWQLSEVYTGQLARRSVVSLYIPVVIDGKAVYDLVIALDPQIFLRILQEQKLPAGWISGIIERNGNFVARTRDHAGLVGKPASSGWRDAAKTGSEGQIDNVSIEGEPLYSAFANARMSGWSASIAATQDLVTAPFRRSLTLIAFIALGLISLSSAFAWWIGRRITTPLVLLEKAAIALQRNEKIAIERTGLKEADQALRAFDASASALLEREEQFRTLADSIPQLAWMAGPDGSIFWYNRRWYDYTGTTFASMQGWGWRSVHDPEEVEGVTERFRQAVEIGAPWEDTFPLRGADGTCRWFLSRALPIRDAAGDIVRWFGTNTDISEQKQAADRQRLLMNELNHRVKNTLAVIQSIAAVTSRSATSSAAFSKSFIARVMGIARTHDVLTERQWESAGLRDILDNELKPYASDDAGRIVLTGPPVQLTPKISVDFGMIVHELATNAAKYGSLSVPEGKLRVEWQRVQVDGKGMLQLQWAETGGPEVKTPERTGFGSRLITDTVTRSLEGRLTFEHRPEGLRCDMLLFLGFVTDEAEAA